MLSTQFDGTVNDESLFLELDGVREQSSRKVVGLREPAQAHMPRRSEHAP